MRGSLLLLARLLFKKNMGTPWFIANVLVMCASYATLGLNDMWLARWTNKVDDVDNPLPEDEYWFHCGMYILLSFGYIFFNLVGVYASI